MGTEFVSQSELIRKNIAAISEMQRRDIAARTPRERISDLITKFAGSMSFVYIHAVWFGLWILLNVNLIHLPYISDVGQ